MICELIDQVVRRRIQLESNPKFNKINRYMNIRDTAQKAIDDEENRPDDPMDIDYTLYNLSRQLPGVPTGRIVNRANTKKKPKPKPKKGARKTKKVARHII